MMTRAAAVVLSVFFFSCNCSSVTTDDGGTGGNGGNGGDGGTHGTGGGSGGGIVDAGPLTYVDFPAAPVLDGVPSVPPGFTAADSGVSADAGGNPGPCLTEPEDGTLFPQDWLRPRFSFVAANGEDVFELRLTAANQTNPLVVYTANPTWTMPRPMWLALTAHTVDVDITLDVRGIKQSTGALSDETHATFRVAPASASGAIVYWTTSNGTALKGFHVGDESVQTVLVPTQVPTSQCIGCHTSTPDGLYSGFSSALDANNGDDSNIAIISVDGGASAPGFLTPSAVTLLSRTPQQAPSFSAGHWDAGDHVALSDLNTGGHFEMIWTDLEATSTDEGTGWGVVTRTGDPGIPASGVFSHDGLTIAYASASNVTSGVTVYAGADIYTVPFNNRQGGTATVVNGANDLAYDECYPSFSSDDALLAFGRVPTPQNSYNNAANEIFVVPVTGAAAPHRIRGNDPPACLHVTSPGITNSWPKWGPLKTVVGAKTYYFLTYSSTRVGGKPQLFVAPLVMEAGMLTSYPALYLWNQPSAEANHTPAWDLFQIAPQIN